ncbi:MAG: hypothetical protein KJ626_03565 [Verrucomicrobia bacterium]|nr:hypothetical protein [Verrucomicrobiota bacterium]
MRRRKHLISAVAVFAAAAAVYAGDGRIEISQSEMPYVIAAGGSYVVTEGLTGTNGSSGITISANDVSLDLNGFTLTGGAGTLDGIRVSGSRTNIVVRNGIVRDWGQDGLDTASAYNSIVTDVKACGNGQNGIVAGTAALIANCTAKENTAVGIQTGAGSLISDCFARSNVSHGVVSGNDTSISDTTARENAGYGINAGEACSVVRCATRGNTNSGVCVQTGSVVADVTSAMNGGHGVYAVGGGIKIQRCSFFGNRDYGAYLPSHNMITDSAARLNTNGGIRVGGYSYVSRNVTADSSGGNGIVVADSYSRVEENQVVSNSVGFSVTGDETILIRNTAYNNATTYSVSGGNYYETVSDPGTDPANFDQPWANYDL